MIKRKGYTLIELLVVLFFTLCIFSCGFAFYNGAIRMKRFIEVKKYEYEIHNLITYGKCICKDKERVGKITIDSQKKTIRFIEGYDKVEKVITCPHKFRVFPSMSYYISEKGKIKGSNTITIMDDNGECHEISIKTGVDTITIKGEINEKE